MKALSIRQPWAELIMLGIKDVENRSRATEYRGSLMIHAARTLDVSKEELKKYAEEYGFNPDMLIYGALIGTVEVINCTLKATRDWHYKGQYGWYLTNPKRLEKPIMIRGRLGLFNV
ncbi:MAG TPA: ASCH domain-containing protein [Spirochaetota bacterium]|nr:ASCH domain-containing protein [Spirochaetota bacterium]